MSDTESPEEIARDIERTRADISLKLEALQERLSPSVLLNEALAMDKVQNTLKSVGAGSAEFAGNVGRAISSNPLPVILTGVGVAWMALASSRRHDGPGEHHEPRPELRHGADGGQRQDPSRTTTYRAAGAASTGFDQPTSSPSAASAAATGAPSLSKTGTSSMSGTSSTPDYPAGTSAYGTESRNSVYGTGSRDVGTAGIQDKVKDVAAEAGARAGRLRDRAAEGAARVSDAVSEGADRLKSAVSAGMDRAGDASSGASERISDRVSGRVSGAVKAGGVAYRRTVDAARDVPSRLGDAARSTTSFIQENPIIVGAAAIALGAGLALMIPSSRREHELLGETSDEVKGSVRETVSERVEDVAQRATSVARTAVEAGVAAAREGVAAAKEEVAAQREDLAGRRDEAPGGFRRLELGRSRTWRRLAGAPGRNRSADGRSVVAGCTGNRARRSIGRRCDLRRSDG